jgi:hypothetical protein
MSKPTKSFCEMIKANTESLESMTEKIIEARVSMSLFVKHQEQKYEDLKNKYEELLEKYNNLLK